MTRAKSAAHTAFLALGLVMGCSDDPSELQAWGDDAGVSGEAEDAVGGAMAAVVGGDVDAAGLRENAVARVGAGGGHCTGTLISPTRMLTAEHCVEYFGPPPTCTPQEFDTPRWENRAQWYPFICSPAPPVIFGASRSKLSVSAASAGLFERFTIVGAEADTLNSGDNVFLRSAGGYYLGTAGDIHVLVSSTTLQPSSRFRVFRASGQTGELQSNVAVRLQHDSMWVRVVEGDVILTIDEDDATTFTMANYNGSTGPILHNSYVTLKDGFNTFMTAEGGGGPAATWETNAVRYNLPGIDDIALLELATPVPAHVATPMDVIHRTPGVAFQARTQVSSNFCTGTDTCLVGDFNGNGFDDLLSVTSGGTATVGSSNGTGITTKTWLSGLQCVSGYSCLVGDYNGDGRDDVARFQTAGGARVARSLTSDEFGYPSLWGFNMPCSTAGKTCVAGDVNGDGRDDVVIFHRATDPARVGDVDVAISTGTGFVQPVKYHDYFCVGTETCDVGDFTRDGIDDIVAFVNDANGYVYVAPSILTGSVRSFGLSVVRAAGFCKAGMSCGVGDFDGDGFSDIAAFTRNAEVALLQKQVRVAISDGEYFGPASLWAMDTCSGNQVCSPADFTGDGRSDIIVFHRTGSPSRVDVARSHDGNPAGGFFHGRSVRAGGWGYVTYGDAPLTPARRRYGIFAFTYHLTNDVILSNLGEGDIHLGDSGSPVRWYDPNKLEWVIVGEVTHTTLIPSGFGQGVTTFSDGAPALPGTGPWFRQAMAAP